MRSYFLYFRADVVDQENRGWVCGGSIVLTTLHLVAMMIDDENNSAPFEGIWLDFKYRNFDGGKESLNLEYMTFFGHHFPISYAKIFIPNDLSCIRRWISHIKMDANFISETLTHLAV